MQTHASILALLSIINSASQSMLLSAGILSPSHWSRALQAVSRHGCLGVSTDSLQLEAVSIFTPTLTFPAMLGYLYDSSALATHPRRALWGACEELALQRGGTADLHRYNIASVAQLQDEHGPFSGTVAAAGAAAGALPEIGAAPRLLLSRRCLSGDSTPLHQSVIVRSPCKCAFPVMCGEIMYSLSSSLGGGLSPLCLHGPFSGTVVAAKAAAGFLPEMGLAPQLLLPALSGCMSAHSACQSMCSYPCKYALPVMHAGLTYGLSSSLRGGLGPMRRQAPANSAALPCLGNRRSYKGIRLAWWVHWDSGIGKR